MDLCVSIGIRKHCTRYEESDYEYRNLTKISNIHYGKQEGYVVRLAFYALADRDAHIIFTTNDLPNFQTDFAYEICELYDLYKNKINKLIAFNFKFSDRRLGQPTYANKAETSS